MKEYILHHTMYAADNLYQLMQSDSVPGFIKKNRLYDAVTSRFVLNSVHEIPEHRLLYVEVPKAGCSSIKISLRHFRGIHDMPVDMDDFHERFGYKNIPLFSFEKILKTKYKAQGWKIFTVVRNPYDRFVSYYKDKVSSDQLGRYINKFSLRKYFHDTHVRPQHALIGTDLSVYDMIGTTENMTEVFAWLRNITGASIDYTHQNKTSLDVSLTQEQKDKIYSLYRKDFTLLGYEK